MHQFSRHYISQTQTAHKTLVWLEGFDPKSYQIKKKLKIEKTTNCQCRFAGVQVLFFLDFLLPTLLSLLLSTDTWNKFVYRVLCRVFSYLWSLIIACDIIINIIDMLPIWRRNLGRRTRNATNQANYRSNHTEQERDDRNERERIWISQNAWRVSATFN